MSFVRRALLRLPPLLGIAAGLVVLFHGYVFHETTVTVERVEADEQSDGSEAADGSEPAAPEEPPPWPPGEAPFPPDDEGDDEGWDGNWMAPPGEDGQEPFPPGPDADEGGTPPPPEMLTYDAGSAEAGSPAAEEVDVVTEWELVLSATQGSIERRSDGRLVRVVYVGRPAQRCPT